MRMRGHKCALFCFSQVQGMFAACYLFKYNQTEGKVSN